MQAQGPRPKLPEPAGRWMAGLALDVRSLALLRVWLAVVVLVEVGRWAAQVPAQLTDAGRFPREAWQRVLGDGHAYWTPYLLSGDAWWAAVWLALTALAALALLLGWHTRLAAAAAWLLVAALHTRLDPAVLGLGEQLLRLLLFWSVWLPLGTRGSVDAALDIAPARPPDRHVSVASAAWFTQLLLAYGLTVLAVATEPAAGVTTAGWLALGLVALLPLLALALALAPTGRGWPRLVAVFGMVALHAGLALTAAAAAADTGFGLGFGGWLPWVAAAAWLALLPSAAWDWLTARLATPERRRLRVYYDGDCGFCQLAARLIRVALALPETSLAPAQQNPAIHERMRQANSWVLQTDGGATYTHYDALVRLLRLSPTGWWLAPLAGLPPVRWLGERAYRWVADHRDTASRAVGWLHYREMRAAPGLLGQRLAAVALVVMLLAAVADAAPVRQAAEDDARVARVTRALRAPAEALRLDQAWAQHPRPPRSRPARNHGFAPTAEPPSAAKRRAAASRQSRNG